MVRAHRAIAKDWNQQARKAIAQALSAAFVLLEFRFCFCD
jgi:hypothetical protein